MDNLFVAFRCLLGVTLGVISDHVWRILYLLFALVLLVSVPRGFVVLTLLFAVLESVIPTLSVVEFFLFRHCSAVALAA